MLAGDRKIKQHAQIEGIGIIKMGTNDRRAEDQSS